MPNIVEDDFHTNYDLETDRLFAAKIGAKFDAGKHRESVASKLL
jgi:hypothetical protein